MSEINKSIFRILDDLIERFPKLENQKENILESFMVIKECFERQGRLYICGNGGSASDTEHIAGELLKSFKIKRPIDKLLSDELKKTGHEGEFILSNLEGGLPVISLCGHMAFSTAYGNDRNPDFVFAQQVSVWGRENDVLLSLSTSGNSKNCIYATEVANAKKMKTIFLGGNTGGKLKDISDVSIIVSEKETYLIQELHLPIYHCICAMLESQFFS